jgi:hypothetical protein
MSFGLLQYGMEHRLQKNQRFSAKVGWGDGGSNLHSSYIPRKRGGSHKPFHDTSQIRIGVAANINQRQPISENAFVEMVVWRVPSPVSGSTHGFKYRLALVVNGCCALRYDNEAGTWVSAKFLSFSPHHKPCWMIFGTTWIIGGFKMRTVTLGIV